MEEDINILTAFLLSNIPEIITQEEFDEVKQAIENLLKGYRKLELENQALENTKNTCPTMNTSGVRCKLKENGITSIGADFSYDEYIPKSKVKEKIKELYEDKDNKYYDMFLEQRDIEKTISILQELTED